jgi:iron(III) transport system permease protein
LDFDVYSTKIYRLLGRENPQQGAATALSVIILASVVPLIILQHWVGLRRQYTTLTGHFKPQLISLEGWRWPVFVAVLGLAVVVAVVPLVFVLLGTLMRLFGFFELTPSGRSTTGSKYSPTRSLRSRSGTPCCWVSELPSWGSAAMQ